MFDLKAYTQTLETTTYSDLRAEQRRLDEELRIVHQALGKSGGHIQFPEDGSELSLPKGMMDAEKFIFLVEDKADKVFAKSEDVVSLTIVKGNELRGMREWDESSEDSDPVCANAFQKLAERTESEVVEAQQKTWEASNELIAFCNAFLLVNEREFIRSNMENLKRKTQLTTMRAIARAVMVKNFPADVAAAAHHAIGVQADALVAAARAAAGLRGFP